MIRYKILGGLEMVHGGRSLAPSPPKVRRVLALLLVRANTTVHPDSIISELWGTSPPRSAVTTVQTYIYHLRKMFMAEGIDPTGDDLLATELPGYVLRMEPDALDSDVFERLADEGGRLLKTGHPDRAAGLLGEALDMWSGPALANVSLGRSLEAHVVRLEERRVHALQMRIQADLELGKNREVTAELRSHVSTYPLDEVFHGQLIQALARSGRRGDALDAYQDARLTLQEQLGLDPSPDLQQLQREILA
jgi:DNA-binding SARP family transcriptional activator